MDHWPERGRNWRLHGVCIADFEEYWTAVRRGDDARRFWESRLAAYDPSGRQLAATSLGNVRQTRFAGELEDGTVAILWRVQYAYVSLTDPVFGWTLDSWNPRTGDRRRLANDLATFPSSENDASMIFLDRRGRLVAPAVGGLRVLARLGYPELEDSD